MFKPQCLVHLSCTHCGETEEIPLSDFIKEHPVNSLTPDACTFLVLAHCKACLLHNSSGGSLHYVSRVTQDVDPNTLIELMEEK